MKIGLIRRGFSSTGGAENYLRRLADALETAGHEPVLLANRSWPRDRWPARREFIPIDASSPLAFAGRVASLAKSAGCDRLFSLERLWQCDCYRAGDGVHLAWLQRRSQVEPLWRRWFRHVNPKHRQLLTLEKSLFAMGGAKTIIANSRMVRDEIMRVYGSPPERIAVIYNGLPGEYFQPVEPTTRDTGDHVILFAGTGWERKGLAHALAAVERLPDSANARLLVAGRGNPKPYLSRLSARGRARVRFLGPVSDMRALYAAADVFVAPTLYDPFSNACLEAMAAGLPVLTTRANGFAEIIEPGVDGEVFETADRVSGEALATLLMAWADPAKRVRARALCAARAAGFTIEKNVVQTLDLLLGSPPR